MFALGEDQSHQTPPSAGAGAEPPSGHVWECSWRVRTAEPVHFMAFSRDGSLFATAGHQDQIVKVWYEKRQVAPPRGGVEWEGRVCHVGRFGVLSFPCGPHKIAGKGPSQFSDREALVNRREKCSPRSRSEQAATRREQI